MYVKLVNPRSGMVMTFQCSGEVYHELQEPMDYDEQQKRMDWHEGNGDEPRRYAIWETDRDDIEKLPMTEIHLPAASSKRTAIVILTNWDAWLCNDNGRSIDRIHKFRVPA